MPPKKAPEKGAKEDPKNLMVAAVQPATPAELAEIMLQSSNPKCAYY